MNKKFGAMTLLVPALIFGGFFVSAPSALAVSLITQINFTNSVRTMDVGSPSDVLTVQTQNSSNTSVAVGTSTTLLLSSTSGTGEFSASSTSWSSVPSLTMRTGSANRNFYYRDSVAGTSTLTVTAQDESWATATQTIIVTATTTPDTEAPVITLLGSNPVDITVGDIYVDAGATATDAVDGSVPVVVTGTVDILAVGTYTLLYTATDTAANIATTTRTVNVKAKAITEATSTPSHRGGSSIVNVNFAFASTTGQVLGTSTEKTLGKTFRAPLTPEQKRLRLLRRHLNRIKIAAYDLRHPELQTNSGVEVLGTSTQSSNSVPLVPSNLTVTDSGEIVSTSTKATTTPKKPFWKLW